MAEPEDRHVVVTCGGCGRYAVANLSRYRFPNFLSYVLTKDPCPACGASKVAHIRQGHVPHPTVVLEG